jgi:hypothetical protein
MFKALAVATALFAGSALADELPPDAAVGRWTGKREQTFALADPSNSDSWECLTNSKVSSRDVTVEIGADGKVSVSAIPGEDISVGAGKYSVPAGESKLLSSLFLSPRSSFFPGPDSAAITVCKLSTSKTNYPSPSQLRCHHSLPSLFPLAVGAQEFMWASWGDNIAQLRLGSNLNQIVCQYVRPNDKEMVMIIRGGSDVTSNWALQCSASTYESLSGFDTAAVCNPAAGSKSPQVSTILYKLSYAGGVTGSGSGLTTVAAGAAAVALAAGAAILLG